MLKKSMRFKPEWLTCPNVTGFFIIFYLVGILLFVFEVTRNLFYLTVPISLLLVTMLILFFHKGNPGKTGVLSLVIFISSFILEYAGIHSGKIFGRYEYLTSLGPKWGEVPLIIGMNWILMVLCSAAVMAEISENFLIRITGGALCMVFYDLVLEAAAPAMNMWHFFGDYPPVQNFVSWFVAAFIFHLVLHVMKINPKNEPARNLFFIQIVFFIFIISFENLR